ncbi:hypothetical protein HYC85_008925 [Camellia sinensis]|uniref:Uncharacterized protein n=1 Tax=Camellia sinensis TaxID=4442 RepID=A0A7J7HTT7_CAMSI|nr:hypothetical protein HYC85_008925 [Camellia sinensis]
MWRKCAFVMKMHDRYIYIYMALVDTCESRCCCCIGAFSCKRSFHNLDPTFPTTFFILIPETIKERKMGEKKKMSSAACQGGEAVIWRSGSDDAASHVFASCGSILFRIRNFNEYSNSNLMICITLLSQENLIFVDENSDVDLEFLCREKLVILL